jgi:cytochrome c2
MKSLRTSINLVIFISFLFLSPNIVSSQELVFKKRDEVVKRLSLDQIEKIIAPKTVTVFEPLELENRQYRGFPVDKLFTAVYGNDWMEIEEVLFTCSDGYQPSIPSSQFREYSSYLVYASPDKKEFTLINKLQNNELVELGPFYLVWDNINNPELRAEGASGWPYQVVAIDLIDFSDRFPNTAPPKNSGDEVKNGFIAFRKYCMTCHSINGEGGTKSVELNYPVSVTEYMEEKWLYRWIDNPQGIRYNTTMPPLNPDTKDRNRLIKGIIAYLKAMKNNKIRPVSETN